MKDAFFSKVCCRNIRRKNEKCSTNGYWILKVKIIKKTQQNTGNWKEKYTFLSTFLL